MKADLCYICLNTVEVNRTMERMGQLIQHMIINKSRKTIEIDNRIIHFKTIRQIKTQDGLRSHEIMLSTGVLRTSREILNETISIARLLTYKSERLIEW